MGLALLAVVIIGAFVYLLFALFRPEMF